MEPKFDIASITLSDPEDTITLSGASVYTYANTTISGGGYATPSYGAVPNVTISSPTGATYSNSTISATSYPYTISTGTGINSPWGATNLSPKIQLNGEGADIEINGESLVSLLKQISERLNLLKPNEKMEAEWDQLRELGEQYRALEAKLKEQSEMWAKLKAMPPPTID
jgi:hypothetical protein